MNLYRKDIATFLEMLNDLGFPKLQELSGRSFTLNYKTPSKDEVIIGGTVESFLFMTSINRNSKRGIIGANITFRVFTNVLYGTGITDMLGHTNDTYQQQERYKLEFDNDIWSKKRIAATWAVQKPRTDEEQRAYVAKVIEQIEKKRSEKETVNEKRYSDFRCIDLIRSLRPGHLVFT